MQPAATASNIDSPAITPRAVAVPIPPSAVAPAMLRLHMRAAPIAALATRDPGGHPFATLTNVATDSDGAPLFLTSTITLYGRNTAADDRISLSFPPLAEGKVTPRAMGHGRHGLHGRHGRSVALGGAILPRARLTVSGHAAVVDDSRVRQRFLARHRKTSAFAAMNDFHIWRLTITAGHFGIGIEPVALVLDLAGAEALVAGEGEVLAILNRDRAPELSRLATGLAGAAPGRWRATGLDPEGLDLALGDETVRLTFPEAVFQPGAVPVALAGLLAEAGGPT